MVREYLRRVRSVTWNRRFFMTKTKDEEKGEADQESIFGLCPEGTKEKDLVCILFGCSVPVILREHKSNDALKCHFELIGEAYVHGKMDGEAMADHEDGKVEDEVFILQ
jgi:hypothetical protein